MKEEFLIPSADGKTGLHGFIWRPENEVKAVLQLVHGMVEYIDRYDAFASYLLERGFGVIGHDHLGHGQSVTDETKLGYFAEKDGDRIVVEDMKRVTDKAREAFPGAKLFILGHSMGSFLVRHYLTLYGQELSGAIIMGTGHIPSAVAGIGKLLSKMVRTFKGEFYRSRFLTGLALGGNNKAFEPARTPVDWLSRNEENVDRYVEDPLCGYLFTANAYISFFSVIEALPKKRNLEKLPKTLPVLITSGEADPVGGKRATEALYADYQKLGLRDVELKLYPGDRHEILNETDRDQVYRDIGDWLTGRL